MNLEEHFQKPKIPLWTSCSTLSTYFAAKPSDLYIWSMQQPENLVADVLENLRFLLYKWLPQTMQHLEKCLCYFFNIYFKSNFTRLFPTYSASRVLISMLIAQHGAGEAVLVGDSGNSGKRMQRVLARLSQKAIWDDEISKLAACFCNMISGKAELTNPLLWQ